MEELLYEAFEAGIMFNTLHARKLLDQPDYNPNAAETYTKGQQYFKRWLKSRPRPDEEVEKAFKEWEHEEAETYFERHGE